MQLWRRPLGAAASWSCRKTGNDSLNKPEHSSTVHERLPFQREADSCHPSASASFGLIGFEYIAQPNIPHSAAF